MSTIIIGVDATERSEDAIAFGRRLADAADARTSSSPTPTPIPTSRAAPSSAAYRDALREDALETARGMRDRLEGIPEDRVAIRIIGRPVAGARAARARARRARRARRSSAPRTPGAPGACCPAAPASACCTARRARSRSSPRTTASTRASRSAGSASPTTTPTRPRRPSPPPPRWPARFGAELEVIGVVVAGDLQHAGADGRGRARPRCARTSSAHVQESLDALVAGLPEGVDGARRAGRPAARPSC